MDKKSKSSRWGSKNDSYLKSRKFSELDHDVHSAHVEEAADRFKKKGKWDSKKDANGKAEDNSSRFEKIELVSNDNPMLKNLDDSNKIENFDFCEATIKHLNSQNLTHLFPIQAATFDVIMSGYDILGRDRTGSGKTLSYSLPLTEKLRRDGLYKKKKGQKPICLVVLPTRELVIQVSNTINGLKYPDDEYRLVSIYGGTEIRQQIWDLQDGAEFVIGTPGRLLDLLERKALSFEALRAIVLDEADHMLDMGFSEDIEKIYEYAKEQTKEELQSCLFSATVPDWVHKVIKKHLRTDYKKVDLVKDYKTPTTVRHLAINCPYFSRNGAIGDIVLCYGGNHCRTIIFTETKKEANEIMLEANIKQECQVLHGDIPQKQREITFKGFRNGQFKCLIATNVAARGLDIPEVDLIVQLAPPKDIDTYVHRAGRTARAGRKGVCVTFYSKKQQELMDRIERKCKMKFEKIGAPQPIDIIKATSRDSATSIKNVSSEVTPLFKDIAQDLIDDIGAIEAMCRALAVISGTSEKFKQRSLLCSIEGFITYIVETDIEFRSVSYIWNFLKRNFDAEVTNSIKGMRSFRNSKGAAFDVPEQYEGEFKEFMENYSHMRGYEIKKAESLPEFDDDPNAPRSNGFNRENSNRSVLRANKDDCKVFVGGMPYDVTDTRLMEIFKQDGFSPVDCLVVKDGDGNSKGFGFAIFDNVSDAQKACKMDGKRLGGRRLNINMANDKPGAKPGFSKRR